MSASPAPQGTAPALSVASFCVAAACLGVRAASSTKRHRDSSRGGNSGGGGGGPETVTAHVLGGGGARCRGTGPIVVCDRVANSGNLGQIIRLCCNVDARQLLCVADPATPAHMFSPKKILARAAKGRRFWDEGRAAFVDAADLAGLLPAQRTVVGVETAAGARDLYAVSDSLRARSRAHALVIVFGAESTGITPGLLALCDYHVFLPCAGPMKSLNVSQCVAAVLCEWYRQSRYVRGEEGAEAEPVGPNPNIGAGDTAAAAAAAAGNAVVAGRGAAGDKRGAPRGGLTGATATAAVAAAAAARDRHRSRFPNAD
jgi:tRNA C32,U32 (ribose-2'-O)-methylase TrmJ